MFIASAHALGSAGTLAQRVRVGHHTLTSDEPEQLGGKDAGPAPFGLLMAGLASCTSITLEMYAARKSWNLGEVKVDVALHEREEKDGGGHRIERTVSVGDGVTPEQKARLAEIAEKTPVTKMLKRAADIVTTFR